MAAWRRVPLQFFAHSSLLSSCARTLERENSSDLAVDELLHLLNVDRDVRLDVSLDAPFSLYSKERTRFESAIWCAYCHTWRNSASLCVSRVSFVRPPFSSLVLYTVSVRSKKYSTPALKGFLPYTLACSSRDIYAHRSDSGTLSNCPIGTVCARERCRPPCS